MSKNTSCALAVFARAPIAGNVKTRLAQTLENDISSTQSSGFEMAAQLYGAMLHDVLALGESSLKNWGGDLKVSSQMSVFFTPDDAFERADDSLREFWDGARYPQKGGDLGARLLDCFGVLRRESWQRIVVIGSDAPDLPPSLIREAFDRLKNCDVVFGASPDGGFYLMGASCVLPPSLFFDVRWSDENTLADVLRNAEARSFDVEMLPVWNDVDTRDDLQLLQKRLEKRESSAPATEQVLEEWTARGVFPASTD